MTHRMRGGVSTFLLLTATVLPSLAAAQAPKAATKFALSDADRSRIEAKTNELANAVAELKTKKSSRSDHQVDLVADVAIAHKAATWVVKFGELYAKHDAEKTVLTLDRGLDRAQKLGEREHPWTSAKGGTVRGYLSKVDGSVQPYAVYVPESYNGSEAARLDVILHGRGATLTEVSFFQSHDGKPYPKDETGLILHVYGRGNNAYRWAGETDVFEAIDTVRRQYRVDHKRILLRGFSMGGAGAWHLGLHHPGAWCSVEAGAGFAETRNYAKLDSIPEYQQKALHIYDAVDYVRNAFDAPFAGYGGEDDPQLRASVAVMEAIEQLGVPMKKDGLLTRADGIPFLHVVGAKTAHRVDPESAKVLKTFRDQNAERGLDPLPKRIRFTTFTLKYNRAHWLAVEALKAHYQPAVVDARIDGDVVVVEKVENVAILAVSRHAAETIRLGGNELPLRSAVKGLLPDVYFRLTEKGWQTLDYDQSRAVQENAALVKHHGLQGPIDDAFAGPFVVVRGTGTAWNPRVQAWSDARRDRFEKDWDRWMRGSVRVLKDTEVTAAELESRNLILFGDPGSNSVIAQVARQLPISWKRERFELGDHYPSTNHAPALIATSPFSRNHYVVINSGHTFGEKDFIGTNALLFPKLGDWAVFRVGDGLDDVVKSGFFDEMWKLK
jgi:dienelactone hydrolase